MRAIAVGVLLLSGVAACGSGRVTHPGRSAPTCAVLHDANFDGDQSTQTFRFVVGDQRAWLVEVETQRRGADATSRLRYDPRGRLFEVTRRVHGDERVSTTRYAYDAVGRPSACRTSEPTSITTTTLAYDDHGRLARVDTATVALDTTPFNNSHDVTTWIRYGDDRRAPPRPLGGFDRIYQVELEATGRWRAFEDLRAQGSSGALELVYDPAGRMIGKRTVTPEQLRRDGDGRIIFRDVDVKRLGEYTYDDLGRPQAAIRDTRTKRQVTTADPTRNVPVPSSSGFRWERHFSYRGCDDAPVADLTPWLLRREIAPPLALGCQPHI